MYDEAVAEKGYDRVRQLLKMLQRFHCTSVAIEGIGARGKIQGSRKFEAHDYRLKPFRCNDAICVPATTTCRSLYGDETAWHAKTYFDSHPTTFTTIKQLFTFVHQLSVAVTIRRISKSERAQFDVNPFAWLINSGPGIRTVVISNHGIVYHCVTLDGKKGIIHDRSSRYLFALTEDILRRVGGDDATTLRVAEVREIVKVEVKNKR